jgi:putative heme-binding domain-containing protein
VGAGSKGAKYFVENVLDPNAVIGNDYRMLLAELDDGRVISGIVEKETDTALTFRTQTDSVVVARDAIEELTTTEQSLMPVGLLETLNPRQVIELLKYLTTM